MPDGTLRTSAGEVVDTVTTDETGFAESKPLYLGKYEIREITAPYGMILNPEIRTAELVYAGQEIEITETSAGFYNERQKAAVSLDKILEQNKQFGIGANGEMSAVTFGLFAAEDLTAADGSVIPADGLLEILSVDENGHADCKTDLAASISKNFPPTSIISSPTKSTRLSLSTPDRKPPLWKSRQTTASPSATT